MSGLDLQRDGPEPPAIEIRGLRSQFGPRVIHENLDLTAGNQVVVSRIQSDAAVNPFDDMLLWVSPNVLISRLAAAGKLP